MKAYRGIVWYLVALYATTIWVNHHHFPLLAKEKGSDKQLSSVSIGKPLQFVSCLLLSESENKAERKECKILMQNLRKQMALVVETAATNPSVSLAFASILLPEITTKNGKTVKYSAVASESKATLIAASIQQLVHKINGKEHDHLVRLFGIAVLILTVFIGLILAPISSTHQYIYLVTVAVFLLFVSFFIIVLFRSLVHCFVRLISFNHCHFWLFPNLTEDVGLLKSFFPIVQCRRNRAQFEMIDLNETDYDEKVDKSTLSNQDSNVFEDVSLDSSDVDDQEEVGQMTSEDEQNIQSQSQQSLEDNQDFLTQSKSEQMFKSPSNSILIPTKNLTNQQTCSMPSSSQQLSSSFHNQTCQSFQKSQQSQQNQETQLRNRNLNSILKRIETPFSLHFTRFQPQKSQIVKSFFWPSSSAHLQLNAIDQPTDDVDENIYKDLSDKSSDEFEFLSENDIPNKV